MENHYSALGVAENATEDEIKKAYRKLASQHHPDKGGDTEKFKTVQTAYDVIGNKDKRAEYDEMRKNPGGRHFRFDTSDMDRGYPPGMEEILRGFGFPGFKTAQQQRRNKDIQARINLTLEETLSPQQRSLSIQTTNGERQNVKVDIPKGVTTGATIKYQGLGDNFFNTLPRGDLYIQIAVQPHPKFQVVGNDLVTPIDVNAIHAIIGCTQNVKTLDGTEFELTIPPGIQGGTKFKIANQGLYIHGHDVRGHLYLAVNIKVPTDLTEEQLSTLKQIYNVATN